MENEKKDESSETYNEDNFEENEGCLDEKMSQETIKQKKRRDFLIELFLFFILGVLIGVAFKTEASKKIAIGFDDYKMKIQKQDYNIGKLQKDLISKQVQMEEESQKNSPSQQEAPEPNNN